MNATRRGHAVMRAIVLVALGTVIGLVHSAVRPVQVRLTVREPQRPAPAQPAPRDPAPAAPAPDGADAPENAPADAPADGASPADTPAAPSGAAAPARPTPDAGFVGAHQPPDTFLDVDALGTFISVWEAWLIYDQLVPIEQGVFIDARPAEQFQESHIPGAVRIDPSSFAGGRTPEVILNWSPEDTVLVIYCPGGDCDASEEVAKQLELMGFQRYHIMKDGFPAWESAGHPVARPGGDEP